MIQCQGYYIHNSIVLELITACRDLHFVFTMQQCIVSFFFILYGLVVFPYNLHTVHVYLLTGSNVSAALVVVKVTDPRSVLLPPSDFGVCTAYCTLRANEAG